MTLCDVCNVGLGFFFAAMAMVVAGLIEVYRRNNAPTPGGYADESARENISPCHSVDDYNPYEYQQWESGQLVRYIFLYKLFISISIVCFIFSQSVLFNVVQCISSTCVHILYSPPVMINR
jgi:hypothetical protein